MSHGYTYRYSDIIGTNSIFGVKLDDIGEFIQQLSGTADGLTADDEVSPLIISPEPTYKNLPVVSFSYADKQAAFLANTGSPVTGDGVTVEFDYKLPASSTEETIFVT